MKIYFYEYEPIETSRNRVKDSKSANSKAHLIRILDMLEIKVIKNTIKEIV